MAASRSILPTTAAAGSSGKPWGVAAQEDLSGTNCTLRLVFPKFSHRDEIWTTAMHYYHRLRSPIMLPRHENQAGMQSLSKEYKVVWSASL